MAKKEKIIIELDFDASDLTKEAAKLNGEIKKLNEEQKALKKSGAEGSIQFQRNAEALRANKKELADTNKAIQNINIANNSATGSMQQQKAQLSLLTAEYNKLSKEERENSAQGEELNAQINQITDSLKGSEESIGDNRRSVGDYGKALSSTPFVAFIGGIRAMGAAFLSNPIGALITVIVAAFAALNQAFSRNEESQNKLRKATAPLTAVFNGLMKVLGAVADFLIDVLGEAFEFVGDVISENVAAISYGLEALGFKDSAKAVSDWKDGVAEAADAAEKLVVAQSKLVKEERQSRLLQLEFQKLAEKQRQIRDDESKSIDERIEANNKLGRVLEIQLKKELGIAKQRLEVNKEIVRQEGASTQNLDAVADALTEIADIEERITGQQSEQLVNINALLKEQEDKRKEAETKRLERVKNEINESKELIDLYVKQQGIRAKTLEEEVEIARKVAEDKKKILERERKEGIVTETQYQNQLLDIENEFLMLQAEAGVAAAQRELDEILKLNQSKIEEGKFLNDELFAQEQQRLTNQLEAQLAFEAARLEQGVITEQEYQDAVLKIKEEGLQKEKELVEAKKAADEEQRVIDEANLLEINQEKRLNEFELRRQQLEEDKAQELAAAEETGADKALIKAKYSKYEKDLDKELRNAQINEALGAFQAIGGLMSENAEAAKAFAISTALINAYQSINAVLSADSTIPEPVGSVVKAVQAAAIGATALINVNKIRSTPVPKAERGIGMFGGKPHSQGGTKGYFDDGTQIEVEKGEIFAVVNKRNSALINNLDALNQLNGNGDSFFARGGTKSYLQDGGIGFDNISAPVQAEENQVSAVLAAVSSLPNPVVIVQDVNEAQGTIVRVENEAQLK